MAKNDQEEAYEKVLVATLTRIHDSQKFAETKNAALIALNSAWTVAGLNLLSSDKPLPLGLAQSLSWALPLIVISAFGSLFSFLPKVNLTKLLKSGSFREPSLIFFGDIAALDIKDYQVKLRSRYLPADKASITPAYEADLIAQISVNSGITARKFRIFTVCSLISSAALVALAIPGVSWIYRTATALFST